MTTDMQGITAIRRFAMQANKGRCIIIVSQFDAGASQVKQTNDLFGYPTGYTEHYRKVAEKLERLLH